MFKAFIGTENLGLRVVLFSKAFLKEMVNFNALGIGLKMYERCLSLFRHRTTNQLANLTQSTFVSFALFHVLLH